MIREGIDYIGGVNYIDTIVDHHPQGYAAGFLIRAAGWRSGLIAARALAATGKCETMRIHGLWHDNHRFYERDIGMAVRLAKKVALFQEQFPCMKIFFSPWLEHRTAELFLQCRNECMKVLPAEIKIVSSGPCPIGLREIHGDAAPLKRYLYSYDGTDMFEYPGLIELHKNANLIFGWIPACNGKRSVDDNTPRKDRTNWLRAKDVRKMVEAFGD